MGKPKMGDAVRNSLRRLDGRLYELRRKGRYWGGCSLCVACNGSRNCGPASPEACAILCEVLRKGNRAEFKTCYSRGLRGASFSELAPNGLPVEHGREPAT